VGQALGVESDFRCDEFIGLPIKDQVRKCRVMALEAKGWAASAKPAIRDAYMDVARQWAALADEMQHHQRLST
jgi:hypothetical protein